MNEQRGDSGGFCQSKTFGGRKMHRPYVQTSGVSCTKPLCQGMENHQHAGRLYSPSE